MTTSITNALDGSPFTRQYWKLFTVISANYFLDGVMFSIAPVVAYVLAPDAAVPILATTLLAETLGAIAFGVLADRLGRRGVFVLTLAMEGISMVILFFTYTNLMAFWLLVSIMSFGVGGEFGAAYATMAELMPARHRGKVVLLATNFWNVGAAVIAGTAIVIASIYEDPLTQVGYLLTSAIGMLIVAGASRIAFPESPRWLLSKMRAEEARAIVKRFTNADVGEVSFDTGQKPISLKEVFRSYKFRFGVLLTVTISQYVSYGMLAYYAPYAEGFSFGIESAPLVVFVANLGASVGALLLIPIIDRARRGSTLLSFIGGTLGAALLTYAHGASMAVPFYLLLFATMVFSEWAWGSISALQSELFPTSVRASVVGLLTASTGIAGALVVYTASYLTAPGFLYLSVIIWAAGMIGSIAWWLRGIESARKALEDLIARASEASFRRFRDAPALSLSFHP